MCIRDSNQLMLSIATESFDFIFDFAQHSFCPIFRGLCLSLIHIYEQSHVEKDYWVSKILRDISLSEYANKTYFKGGTSLSKSSEKRSISP